MMPYLSAYRGDPGLFKSIGKFLKKAVPVAAGFLAGGPVGALAAGIASSAAGAPSPSAAALVAPPIAPMPRALVKAPGLGGMVARQLPGGRSGYMAPALQPELFPLVGQRKRRRINPANPKALRRAIRRQAGFVKLAKRALKGSGYRIVSASSQRRPTKIQEAGPGSVYVQK